MADKTIPDYTAAGAIDASADYFLMYQNSSNSYKKINRNSIMGNTGTPVDTTSVQTLQNKVIDNTNTVTVKDTLFTLQDDGDTSKQARFQLSGITTATTRTYTLPNASSTLADLSTAQTFTNKTLTAPTITNGSITGTTITTDAIVGQSAATSGTVYGLSVSSSKISGTSITNSTITTTQIASSTITGANINWASTLAPNGIWWQEISRTTLAVAGDTITLSSIPARKYLRILVSVISTGGTITVQIRFNNDTGASYSARNSTNGAADASAVSQTQAYIGATTAADVEVIELFGANITSQEKVFRFESTGTSAAGAATAPNRTEGAIKWANTSAQISRVDLLNTGAGDFAIGSEVVILGHD